MKKATVPHFILLDILELSDRGETYNRPHKALQKLEEDRLIRKAAAGEDGWIITDAGRSLLSKLENTND
ncbi:hypothetical protein PH562_16500 [Rhizobium sp. CNPSo 4062]|uniref:hypothetical protein n=1 Tax=Rhizobium sp. CNPSo 4062 TaxID=3021410 RepID=UPI00254FD472|nr:hypothetical protein [Rhizobium sp. CNPSo 4062]MDK4703853.1 hypothetical protein [Rhizobium sp. CNPSo 4062]